MKKDYTPYKAEDLLQNDIFLKDMKNPTEESTRFWHEQIEKSPQLAQEIKLAKALLQTIKKSEQDYTITDDRIYLLKKRIDLKNQQQKKRTPKHFTLSLVSAAVAAVILLFILFSIPKETPQKTDIDYNRMAQYFDTLSEDDSQQIRLILNDTDELILDGKEAQIDYSRGEEIHVNTGETKVTEKKPDSLQFNQLVVPRGKRSFLTLADGTKVWVNADSRLIYPAQFSEEKREIYIEGEVFLDVISNPDKPFIVKTSAMEVTVLGTQFNVSAYKEDNEQFVLLVEGKVEVTTGNERTIIHPNQKISVSDSGLALSGVDNINDFIAWKNGYYQFREKELDVLFQKLSRFYGIDFTYNEKIKEFTCSGKLNLSDEINEVMNILQKAAPILVRYEEDTNHIYIDIKP